MALLVFRSPRCFRGSQEDRQGGRGKSRLIDHDVVHRHTAVSRNLLEVPQVTTLRHKGGVTEGHHILDRFSFIFLESWREISFCG